MRISRVCKLLQYGGRYANPIVRFYFPSSYMTFTVFICFAYSEEPSHLSYYGIY
jgi:hypothetical protein